MRWYQRRQSSFHMIEKKECVWNTAWRSSRGTMSGRRFLIRTHTTNGCECNTFSHHCNSFVFSQPCRDSHFSFFPPHFCFLTHTRLCFYMQDIMNVRVSCFTCTSLNDIRVPILQTRMQLQNKQTWRAPASPAWQQKHLFFWTACSSALACQHTLTLKCHSVSGSARMMSQWIKWYDVQEAYLPPHTLYLACFLKLVNPNKQSKACTIRSWENFASAHNHAPDMQSKPVFYSLMLKAEQGLMGVGNGDGVFVCLRCVVLKQTPVLCLHAPAFILHTKSQDNITEMEQLRHLCLKKKGCKPESITSYIIYTRQTIHFQFNWVAGGSLQRGSRETKDT